MKSFEFEKLKSFATETLDKLFSELSELLAFLTPYLNTEHIVFWVGGFISVTSAALFKRMIVNYCVRKWPRYFRRGPRWRVLNKWKKKAEAAEEESHAKDLKIATLEGETKSLEKDVETREKTIEERDSEIARLKIQIKQKDRKINTLSEAIREDNDDNAPSTVIRLA